MMIGNHRSWLPWMLCAFGLVLIAGCRDNTQPLAPDGLDELSVFESPWDDHDNSPLKVMSRNVYWGGSIAPIFAIEDFSNIPEVVAAVETVWDQFTENYMQERAMALVDEIAEEQPDIVGFQEVVQILVLDDQFQLIQAWDFVRILESIINARGLPYTFFVSAAEELVLNNTEVVLPKALGPLPSGFGVTEYVKFLERIAVLVHTDLVITDWAKGNYAATYNLGGVAELKRGWIRVTTERNGTPHHFLDTHLEIQELRPVQEAQTQELILMLNNLDGLTILVGDLNSDAEAAPDEPTYTLTYGMLMDAGMVDAWELDPHNQNQMGLTCCHDNDLRNPVPLFYQRNDFVLLKASWHPGNGGNLPGQYSMDILGEEQGDRTAINDLWPSDHAGLSADIWLPLGQFRRN